MLNIPLILTVIYISFCHLSVVLLTDRTATVVMEAQLILVVHCPRACEMMLLFVCRFAKQKLKIARAHIR